MHADLLLLVTPAQNLAATAAEMAQTAEHLPPGVVCAKGIERQTGALMSDAVRRAAPELPLAVLSGPTFAREVAVGLPAADLPCLRRRQPGCGGGGRDRRTGLPPLSHR